MDLESVDNRGVFFYIFIIVLALTLWGLFFSYLAERSKQEQKIKEQQKKEKTINLSPFIDVEKF